jgi:hypothetical protein
MESARNPHGIHTQSTRSPHRIHMESARSPHGVHTESTWSPHGVRTESARNPHGVRTESARTPHGVSTESPRSPYGLHGDVWGSVKYSTNSAGGASKGGQECCRVFEWATRNCYKGLGRQEGRMGRYWCDNGPLIDRKLVFPVPVAKMAKRSM